MARNPLHPLLIEPDSRNAARQRFVLALKKWLQSSRPALRKLYETEIKISADETAAEIRDSLYQNKKYQVVCRLRRTAQQLMWQSVAPPIDREAETLAQQFRHYSSHPDKVGSLELNPALQAPASLAQRDVHLQPGGYFRNESNWDMVAGALYEAGGALYSQGQNIGVQRSKAELVMRHIAEVCPGFVPKNILDLGCAAGASSVPYAQTYPGAEVHAIDLAPGLLRYAHARAEAMGAAVHFHQMDATDTTFPDGSFDLVASHNAMHEMSDETRQAMFAESRRLLAPGGICVHQDVPLRFAQLDAFLQAEYAYDQWFNAEPHWLEYARCDCQAMMLRAGFKPEHIAVANLEQGPSFSWFAILGRHPIGAETAP